MLWRRMLCALKALHLYFVDLSENLAGVSSWWSLSGLREKNN